MTLRMTQADPVQDALDVLLEALEQSRSRMLLIETRAHAIRGLRAEGHSYAEITAAQSNPLVVELLSDTIALLHAASGPFRREAARALYAEGMTMQRIAAVFGVTRQRVSELLQSRTPPTLASK
jgi:hypothetical protein